MAKAKEKAKATARAKAKAKAKAKANANTIIKEQAKSRGPQEQPSNMFDAMHTFGRSKFRGKFF